MKEKKPFELHITGNAKMGDIDKLAEEGRVGRTPHLGQQNMVAGDGAWTTFATNVLELLYDFNIGAKDRYHHPHIKVDERGHIERIHNSHDDRITYSQPEVTEHHMRTIKKAFPDTAIERWSDFIHERRELVFDVLKIIGPYLVEQGLFERKIDEEGNVFKYGQGNKPRTWEQVVNDGIVPITSKHKGWLLPNVVNVLLMAFIDSVELKTDEVHHISGAEMGKYITAYEEDLNNMYDMLRKKFGLHNVVRFNLHLGASAKFITVVKRSDDLNDLIASTQAYQDFLKEKGEKFSLMAKNGASKKEIGEAAKEMEEQIGKKVKSRLREAVREQMKLGREGIFADISRIETGSDGKFRLGAVTHEELLNQHDGNPAREGVYAHKIMQELTLNQLAAILELVHKIRKEIERRDKNNNK